MNESIQISDETQAIIDEFLHEGRQASYHYADDSRKEWGAGHKHQRRAMEIFDVNPDLQDWLLEEADFLWSVEDVLWERQMHKRRECVAFMAPIIKQNRSWGRAASQAKEKFPEIDPEVIDIMGFAAHFYEFATSDGILLKLGNKE